MAWSFACGHITGLEAQLRFRKIVLGSFGCSRLVDNLYSKGIWLCWMYKYQWACICITHSDQGVQDTIGTRYSSSFLCSGDYPAW